MRIINDKNLTTLNSILIMLTPSEAAELIGYLRNLAPSKGDHLHVDDAEYKREITVAVYTDENLQFFGKEIQDIIETS